VRALVVHELSGAAGSRVSEVGLPAAPEGAVRVAVVAAGLGFVDTLLARGRYQVRLAPPFVPGLEFSGVVEQAPPGCGFRAGQPVVGHVMGGACAETVWADPALLAELPAELDHELGAASVVNHHTALVALGRRARLRPGERVLVHGAGGGLGSAVVQIAVAMGAHVSAVAGTADRRRLAADAGAEVVHDPREWVDAVRAAGGVDVIVDPVGGEFFEQSLRCLAPEGRLVTVGFTSGTIPAAPANRLLLRNASVVGAAWRELLTVDPQLFRRTAEQWSRLVHDGLRPLIGCTYPLAEAAKGLAAIEDRTSTGKVVVVMGR
jgi:NADPH:quinone reductase